MTFLIGDDTSLHHLPSQGLGLSQGICFRPNFVHLGKTVEWHVNPCSCRKIDLIDNWYYAPKNDPHMRQAFQPRLREICGGESLPPPPSTRGV